jgi:crotonobetainyl-CoA:carnitine CoA-transferase CaiB-like acyl-CoA transferase
MCNKEKFWPVLCDSIGRPEWRDRADYKDFKARLANRDKLTVELDAALSTRTTAEWIERFAGTVPAAPVHDVKAALENAFVKDEGRVCTATRAEGAIRLLAAPIKCPGDQMPCEPAPALGADTDDVLTQIGFARDEIARLRATGAL